MHRYLLRNLRRPGLPIPMSNHPGDQRNGSYANKRGTSRPTNQLTVLQSDADRFCEGTRGVAAVQASA